MKVWKEHQRSLCETVAESLHSTEWGDFLCIFKTVDEQIMILKQRGLTIHNEERARRYLLTSNYYAIINGYSKFFQDRDNHFMSGASFDEIRELYWFDKEIKQILFDGILNAEHHLKFIAAYRFAEISQNEKYGYLNIGNYDHEKLNYDWKLISKLSQILSSNCKYNNNTIYHNIHTHNDVPIWVLVDFFDFGTLRAFIRDLPHSVQNKIAVDCIGFIQDNVPGFYSAFPVEIMNSFIKNIHETRNICAHNKHLLKFECRSDVTYLQQFHSLNNITNENGTRKSVYSTFISLQCFLSKTEYRILSNTIRKRMRNLNHKVKSININTILDALGFPDNWQECPALVQTF